MFHMTTLTDDRINDLYATAAELFADFIRTHPDSPHLADARLMLGRAYARTGRCGEAVGAYREVAAADRAIGGAFRAARPW